jgi:hypothetical protein
MPKEKKQIKRVNNVVVEATKNLMEFCIKEEISNAKITCDAKTSDGEHYRLIFERIDLDETLNKI